jgi:ankyrin repeat protein
MKCSFAITLLSAVGLLGAGPDVRLAEAAKKMDRAAIRALLEQRLDVNAAQVDGTTPLHWAAHQDDLETAELLVRAGANVKAANRYGVTPLSLACTNGNGAMVELLLKAGADPNTALPGGETALMTAARAGKVGAVRALLAGGADLSAKESRHGQTALMWAAAEGNVEVVEALIEAGADFRARLDSGFTPFLFAVREGQMAVVQALVKAGADVNETIQTRQADGKRPASGAGAPRPGTSALVLAVTNAHYELAAWLLDAGADPNAAGTGLTALHVITGVRKPGGGDNDPAPQGSGSMTSIEFVKKLAAKDANLNARMTRRVNIGLTRLNTLGATPFFLAARAADAELMRTLAALGADPLLPNADNSTPLMAAAGLGTRSPGEDAGTESEVVEAMQAALDLGADLDAVDKNGETAMHGAAYKNLPAAVQFLADKGAKIEIWNRKNKFGWTPLAIASGYRFGNFKPSAVTVAALQRVMSAAGVSTVLGPVAGRSIY